MAIVVPMRKKYKPRHIVESVVDNVLRLRSNCNKMSNPNTQAQQYVRSRFKLIQGLQRGLSPLFKRGFNRQLNNRQRWVGAYHIALGYNMKEAAHYNAASAQWECLFARLAICEHRSRAPKRITVQRAGHRLIMSYLWKGQAERTGILWAVYNTKRGAWVYGIHDTHLNGKVTACAIPPEWREEPLEVLIGFGRDAQGRGKLRGTHHFSFVKSEGIVTVRGGTPQGYHARNGGNTHTPPHAIVPWLHIGQGSASWLELKDSERISLRISVLYLRE